MKQCGSCEQQNPDDAQFCHRCAQAFPEEPVAPPPADDTPTDDHLWETFIGSNPTVMFSPSRGWAWRPAAEYYLAKFAKFRAHSPRFELSWNWAAFLFDFLWFLYRKMYMYALLYAVGPFLALYLTGIPTVGIVWKIMAAVTGNYLYFWHVKDHLEKFKAQGLVDHASREKVLKEEGGVQSYVIWLAALLMLFGMLFSNQILTMNDGVPMEQSAPDPRVHLNK